MVSTVKTRPNHYELLGVAPAARADEIAQAFAKLLSEPRPFGSLAEVTVAYETLRDPTKRKAYDSSLGLRAEPKPALSLAGRLEAAQFMGATASRPARIDLAPASSPAVRMTPRPRPEPIFEPKAAPVVAVREEPSDPPVREPVSIPLPEQLAHPAPEPRFHDAGETSINWRLPAIAAGALVLAVGIGAWTGWEAGNDSESVTVTVPKAKPLTPAAQPATAAAVADNLLASTSPSVARRATAAPRPARTRPPLQITLPEKQEAEVTVLEQKQRELETEQAAVESAAPPATAAKLPLPDAVIARTIGRIGYPCGQVASAAAVDGSPGVFTVTCTSGHSYRASPVRGRYHFRRVAGR